MLSFSACDHLRTWAGRPTSSDLQTLALRRDSLEKAKAARAAEREDSLRRVWDRENARNSDSLQVEEMLRGDHPRVINRTSRYQGCESAPALFSLIAGTFREPGNAARLCERLKWKGFDKTRVLKLRNGYSLVSVYEDNEAAPWLHFYHVSYSLLPEDCWLLIDDMR